MEAGRHLLALETSGKSGSVAIATSRSDGSLVIEQEVLAPEWGSARTLAPAIADLLNRQQLTPRRLDAIAVVQGPGSFTGLRVGAATAKTMAWALGIPLIAVDALDCVAHQVRDNFSLSDRKLSLIVVSDAYRGQVFRAIYQPGLTGLSIAELTAIEDIDSLLGRCAKLRDREWILAGPGLGKILKKFEEKPNALAHLFVKTIEGPESIPMASTVAQLGWESWGRGETVEVLSFLPRYYRGSAAEEKQKGLVGD